MIIHKAIYVKLIEVAHDEGTITYGEIAPLANLDLTNPGDRTRLSWILGTISTYEHEQKRPMLSVIVILAGKGFPGPGFFNLARELGRYGGHSDMEDLEFFAREVKKVHAYWKTHD